MISYKFISKEEFLPIIEKYRPIVFAETNDVNVNELYSDEETAISKELGKMCITEYRQYLTAWDGEKLVGWSWGYQKSGEEFYMCNSAVLPEYRQQKIYTTLMNLIVEKVVKDGFKEITSKHAASNNAVIIPKLKAGFVILGFEISTRFGLMINLIRYSNEKVLKVHHQRTGFLK